MSRLPLSPLRGAGGRWWRSRRERDGPAPAGARSGPRGRAENHGGARRTLGCGPGAAANELHEADGLRASRRKLAATAGQLREGERRVPCPRRAAEAGPAGATSCGDSVSPGASRGLGRGRGDAARASCWESRSQERADRTRGRRWRRGRGSRCRGRPSVRVTGARGSSDPRDFG